MIRRSLASYIDRYVLLHSQYTYCGNKWTLNGWNIFCSGEEFVDLEKEFEQNELNSAVYLISMAMQISNFAVNYKVVLHNPLHDAHHYNIMCDQNRVLPCSCAIYNYCGHAN